MIEYGCFVIKPDAYIRGIQEAILTEIRERCSAKGLATLFIKERKLTSFAVRFIYRSIADRPFFADFLQLMQEAPSMLVLVQGGIGLDRCLKEIRGSRPSTSGDPATGIRGKYCSVVDVSKEDVRQWEMGVHPEQLVLSKKMLCNVLHCSDNELEALKALWVFTGFQEKVQFLKSNSLLRGKVLCWILGHQ